MLCILLVSLLTETRRNTPEIQLTIILRNEGSEDVIYSLVVRKYLIKSKIIAQEPLYPMTVVI